MRSAANTPAAFLLALVSALTGSHARARADGNASELDQFEERNLGRAIERAVRAAKSDRAAWIKELESDFPSKVGNPLKEEEYAVWFDLLADKNGEWRRDSSPSSGFKELFDRVIQRLELGPVPNVKREEFLKYAKKALVPGNPPTKDNAPDPNEDADRAFRALDRDGDGILELEEMTTKLREERKRADTDGNGRIDKDEYRAYFQKRVTTSVEAALAKPNERENRGGDAKPPVRPNRAANGLPDWFTDLDADKDGQISLSEWRKGKKDIELFMAMDLNGDGLLTKDEYQRYLKLAEDDEVDNPVKGKPEGK